MFWPWWPLGIRQAIFTLPFVAHYKFLSLIPNPTADKCKGPRSLVDTTSLKIQKCSLQIQLSIFLWTLWEDVLLSSPSPSLCSSTLYQHGHNRQGLWALPTGEPQSTNSSKIQRVQQKKPRNRTHSSQRKDQIAYLQSQSFQPLAPRYQHRNINNNTQDNVSQPKPSHSLNALYLGFCLFVSFSFVDFLLIYDLQVCFYGFSVCEGVNLSISMYFLWFSFIFFLFVYFPILVCLLVFYLILLY